MNKKEDCKETLGIDCLEKVFGSLTAGGVEEVSEEKIKSALLNELDKLGV